MTEKKYLRHDDYPDIIIIVSVQEAIEIQKKAAGKHNYVYKTDQDALDDYISVNWASWCDEHGNILPKKIDLFEIASSCKNEYSVLIWNEGAEPELDEEP